MKELTAKIIDELTDSVELSFSRPNESGLVLNADSTAKFQAPKDRKAARLLLKLTTTASDSENRVVKMRLVTTFSFELSDTPEDYKQCGENICLPIAEDRQLEIIDNVLKNFGFQKSEDSE